MHGRRDVWRPTRHTPPIRPIPPSPRIPRVPGPQLHRMHRLPGGFHGRRHGVWRATRRVPPPFLLLLVVFGVVFGLSVIAVVLTMAVVAVVLASPVLLTVGVTRLATRRRRREQALSGLSGPSHGALTARAVIDPLAGARSRFATLRSEYAAYECDALAVLRLPALADVTIPSTARFVEAFAEAQALDTDGPVPDSHRDRYVAAVDTAWRAWQAAREAAERIRLSHLPEKERSTVERVVRLLTTARDTDNDAERHVAYGKARSELARLERTTTIRIPRLAQAKLDNAYRGQLPS